MKIFITGISGFIGSNLAKTLLEQGHEIHALVRTQPKEPQQKGLYYFQGDLDNRELIRKAMAGCKLGFHLAAFARAWAKDPGLIKKINYDGAVNVFGAALDTGIKRLVFTSSAATMESSRGGIPVDENTPRRTEYFNEYERTKALAEEEAIAFTKRGLPIVTVNPSRVYGFGPLNQSNSVTKIILKYAQGKWRIIPADGKSIGNYVYIDDVVNGHIRAATVGRPGERYILGGENLDFHQLFSTLAAVTGKHHHLIHFPLPMMIATTKTMEMVTKLTGIPPLITTSCAKKYMHHWSLSSQKAIQELEYTITPFEQGARKTLDDFFHNPTGNRR